MHVESDTTRFSSAPGVISFGIVTKCVDWLATLIQSNQPSANYMAEMSRGGVARQGPQGRLQGVERQRSSMHFCSEVGLLRGFLAVSLTAYLILRTLN